MTEASKQWEGQVVNGEFYLRQYLGGSEDSAVFLTEYGEGQLQKAAIKLVPAHSENAELQLSEWRLAAKLSHPRLIQLFQMGRCQLDNVELLYLVMDYAEENLAQILPHRRLTPVETREILEPILEALAYVHGQDFVHGHIKPANIMAVDDQLEISTDGLCLMDGSKYSLRKASVYDAPEIAVGVISPAADIWSLGMTLVEALTQRLPVWEGSEDGEPVLPETLPAPFSELVRRCLQRDVERRWTAADILAHISQTSPAPEIRTATEPRPPAKRRYVAPAIALGLILAAVLAVPRLFNRHPEAQRSPSTAGERPEVQPTEARKRVSPGSALSANRTDDKKDDQKSALDVAPPPTRVQSGAAPTTPAVGRNQGEVAHQVLPNVPRQARGTIRGKVKVGVRVRVDPSGKVVEAKLDSPGPSKYFAQLALKAARGWRFTPAKVEGRDISSEWMLRFEFGRSDTRVLPVQTAP